MSENRYIKPESHTEPQAPDCAIDPKQLARLVVELNIARKQINAYPKGHPVIAESTQKALDFLQKTLENCDRLRLGVARDSLWLGIIFWTKKILSTAISHQLSLPTRSSP